MLYFLPITYTGSFDYVLFSKLRTIQNYKGFINI